MIPFVTVVRLSQGGVTPGCHMFSIGKPVNRTEPAFPAPNGCSNSSNNSRCLVWCCLWQKKWKRKRNCGEIKKKNLQTLFFFFKPSVFSKKFTSTGGLTNRFAWNILSWILLGGHCFPALLTLRVPLSNKGRDEAITTCLLIKIKQFCSMVFSLQPL